MKTLLQYGAAIAIALHLVGCGLSESSEPVRAIQAMQVEALSTGQVRRIAGIVEAGNQADVSFQVGGHVTQMRVKLGESISANHVIATLDPKPFELNYAAAKAELTKANAILTDKKIDFESKSTLLEKKFISKAMVDTARAEYESAIQNVKSAESKLELAQRDLEHTQLKAPFDGKVATRYLEAGSNVTAGQPIIHLVGDQGFEVSVALPESLRMAVKMDMPVKILFPSLDNAEVQGEVAEIAASTQEGNAFLTKIRILTPDIIGLYAGLTAEVRFEFQKPGSQQGYLIPVSALIAAAKNEKGAYVFVYDPQSEVVRKKHILISEIRENNVEVIEGLSAGDIIATAGVHFLVDGQHVTLYKESEQ